MLRWNQRWTVVTRTTLRLNGIFTLLECLIKVSPPNFQRAFRKTINKHLTRFTRISLVSTTSLSSSFTSSSSSPPTPSDIFSSFTDSNGVSRHFLNHNNQPLSMYPPTPEKDVKVEFIEDDATAFARYVYMNKTKGTISVEGVQNDGFVIFFFFLCVPRKRSSTDAYNQACSATGTSCLRLGSAS